MKKHSALIAAMIAGLIVFSSLAAVHAAPPPREAKIITQEEAAKKYPPPQGKSYPNGMDAGLVNDIGSAAHTGFIKSPYSSLTYDCRKIGSGTLLLDESAKKVFVRP